MSKVQVSLVADDFRIFEVDLTSHELAGVMKVLKAYENPNIGTTSGPYLPVFQVVDLDANREMARKEKEKKLEEQKKQDAEDARKHEEERLQDLRENGPFAVAYRKALEKKKAG